LKKKVQSASRGGERTSEEPGAEKRTDQKQSLLKKKRGGAEGVETEVTNKT